MKYFKGAYPIRSIIGGYLTIIINNKDKYWIYFKPKSTSNFLAIAMKFEVGQE